MKLMGFYKWFKAEHITTEKKNMKKTEQKNRISNDEEKKI